MFLNKKAIFFFLAIIVSLNFSCSEYQKVLKSDEVKAKYELAEKFYEEGDFKRANRLYEQIAPKYIGKPQGERVFFFFSNTYYKIKDYNTAGYQFERFLKSYPKSDKASEAAFLGAKSYYMLSPRYSLDQTDTDKALAKIQNFINTYPDSEYFAEANIIAKELRSKKEKKELEIAKQFTKLGEFYTLDNSISAIAALDNFLTDNSGSIYREDALFYKIKASTNLALNSTERKKKKRLEEAKLSHAKLKKYFPESKYQKKVDNLLGKVEKELKNYSK